ncbi:MAG: cytochrome c oxidase subunit II [Planctomycetota bacterium]
MIAFQDPLGQLPPQASTFAADTDALFYFLTWVSLASFALIVFLLIYSSIRWRRKTPDQPAASDVTHNTRLEVIWTLIPSVIVIIVFAWGFKGIKPQQVAPSDARKYRATARMWGWDLYHPGAQKSAGELWFEVNKPAMVQLTSEDVLHAFFIPAFRIKRDVVPGFRNQIWFEPTLIGDYTLYCAEYCGTNHSQMRRIVHVVSAEDYAKKPWDVLPKTPEGRGEYYYNNKGCLACHAHVANALPGVGPNFWGIYGRKGRLADGSEYTADDAYLTESILYSQNKIVQGFGPPSLMPSFATTPKDEVEDIIAWMKTLK